MEKELSLEQKAKCSQSCEPSEVTTLVDRITAAALHEQVTGVRGQHACGHIKQLEDLSLLSYERAGRSKLMRTTELFADYFGLSHDLNSEATTQKHVPKKRIWAR